MLNTVAFAGEQVVLGWLVLDLTNSPLLVGVALALRMAPLLVVGLPAGVLADRGDRIVLLRGANTTMALALTALGTLAVLGRVHDRADPGAHGSSSAARARCSRSRSRSTPTTSSAPRG